MTSGLTGPDWRAEIADDGRIDFLETSAAGERRRVDFRSDEYAGPRWYGEWDGRFRPVTMTRAADLRFEGACDGLRFGIEYAGGDALAVIARIRNERATPFRPIKAGLRLGLDTYMEKYPDWNRKLFPTLLRCERTHFWGYCMSPEGALLVVASPDPVASWSLNYNRASYGDYGHRIYTLNLDLMNALPLPPRHPHLDELWPGEERRWRVLLRPAAELAQVKAVASVLCGAPMFDIDRLTLAPGERADVTVVSPGPVRVTLLMPGGERRLLCPEGHGKRFVIAFTESDAVGLYTLRAEGVDGKVSEAMVFLRRPWSWYMKQARSESLRIPQKASTHNEGWMGLYTQVLARRRFPDADLDTRAEAVFRDIVPQMFDANKGEPVHVKTRVQNIAYMAGLYAARYRCGGDVGDLEAAARFCDYVLRFQAPSGALLGNAGKGAARVHYTSVCYPIKSVLEVCIEEKKLAATDAAWAARFARHWAGAKGAMDDLVRQKDNIDTEGEITFEDGMISCSAAQLGFFALLQDDPVERQRYAEAAEYILRRHRCLQQLLIPDCRMNGGTLRFWESQYDVLLLPNMMNSPHGWTSWKTYATWYLYLLTGKEEYLVQTMNTVGACMQVIDPGGRLRWGFVPDPHVRAEQFGTRTHWRIDLTAERVFIEDPARPGCREAAHPVIGEQYVEMISDVYPGWCCDNDVHEHFKCLDETVLASACVLEREGGELAAWNCSIEERDGRLAVTPAEAVVGGVHFNLKRARRVTVRFDGEERSAELEAGLNWVYSARRTG